MCSLSSSDPFSLVTTGWTFLLPFSSVNNVFGLPWQEPPVNLEAFLLPDEMEHMPDMFVLGTQESGGSRSEWEVWIFYMSRMYIWLLPDNEHHHLVMYLEGILGSLGAQYALLLWIISSTGTLTGNHWPLACLVHFSNIWGPPPHHFPAKGSHLVLLW